ncbi:hypothetical protein Tco_0791496 [Tanacetum coccineum]
MLDYEFNFMNTKIYIDNESTICIAKNLVFHSKTKHIEIRNHFIRDYYEKKLIQVIKIYTYRNVADLLTKAFDVSSPTIYASYIEQFWNTATSKTVNSVKQIHAIVNGKVVVISESSVRSDLLFNDEDGDRPRHQDTTLGGADAKTRPETASKTSHDPPLSEVNTSGCGEDNMEYHDDLTNFVPPTPHDSPLLGGNTPGSDEGRMELIQELMETYTSLTKMVLVLEETKTAQDRVITKLKLRVKRLKKKRKARNPQLMKRRLFKGRVETSTDKSLGKDASKQGRNNDKTEELNLTGEDKGSGEKGGSTTD